MAAATLDRAQLRVPVQARVPSLRLAAQVALAGSAARVLHPVAAAQVSNCWSTTVRAQALQLIAASVDYARSPDQRYDFELA
jgi:hypothetical protein